MNSSLELFGLIAGAITSMGFIPQIVDMDRVDQVVTVFAVEAVIAGTTGDRVMPIVAIDGVVSRSALKDVIAVSAVVDAADRAGGDRIGPAPCVDLNRLGTGQSGEVRRGHCGQIDLVVALSAGDLDGQHVESRQRSGLRALTVDQHAASRIGRDGNVVAGIGGDRQRPGRLNEDRADTQQRAVFQEFDLVSRWSPACHRGGFAPRSRTGG